jgi:hypothetical protein
MSSFIPTRDGDLNLWAVNFDTLITANPVVYGLTPADAAFIHFYVDAFTTALQAASDPSTRGPASVAAKDGAKAAMLDIIRTYARQIRDNLGIGNEDKVALGLTIPDLIPSPIPAPSSTPILAILGATPLSHTIRYADSNMPNGRSKPFGAMGMQLFCWVGDNKPAEPEQWRLAAFVTHQPFGLTFQAADVGKTAFYRGRWQTRTGRVGDFGAEASMIVVG